MALTLLSLNKALLSARQARLWCSVDVLKKSLHSARLCCSVMLVFKYLLIAVGAALLSACATSSLFNPYPRQAGDYIDAIQNDTMGAMTQQLIDRRDDQDSLLYMQESGRLNQLNKNYAASTLDFDYVLRAYQAVDDRATVSASRVAAQGISLVSNENAIPYSGQSYERIFALLFQAFNYLAQQDLEAASVAIRRAAYEQRRLELAYADEIVAAESAAKKQNIRAPQWLKEPELAAMNTFASETRNSFLNAYVFYCSAVIWEAQGDWNAALVDYKKALQMQPNNAALLAAIKRVNQAGDTLTEDQGQLVVLYEEGFIPAKKSFNLSIYSYYYQTFFNIAFPYYDVSGWPQPRSLVIRNNETVLGTTEVLVNASALAVKALQEQSAALLVRQMLRARTKHEMQQQMQDQHQLGGIAASIYNIVSEQADLRSWLTLPNSAQALDVALEKGMHTLVLQQGNRQHRQTVNIIAGHTTILRVIDSGQRIITETFVL